MGSEEEEFVVRLRNDDDVTAVVEGTKILIIDKSIKETQGMENLDHSPFPGYESIEEIIVEEGVEVLGYRSFSKCMNLVKVILPSTLSEIKPDAFSDCSSLTEFDLSNTKITKIGDWAFYKCESLERADIPEGVDSIGKGAFRGCKNLKTVTFPSTLELIQSGAFYNCESLERVDIPEGVESVGYFAFYGCKILKSVTFPPTLKYIQDGTFYGCNFTSLIIPKTVHSIGDQAFSYCKNLATVEIDESTKVHQTAFLSCASLPSFMIENNILSNIILPESRANIIIQEDEDIKVRKYKGNDTLQVVKVGQGVKEIGLAAFEGCTSLEKITFSDSVEKIGSWAFNECTSLKEIIFPEKLTEIQKKVLHSCSSLTKVTLMSSTTSIKTYAFCNCTSLPDIILPESIKEIDKSAFANCKSLKKIKLPTNLKCLGGSVFKGCISLENVTFNNGIKIENISSRAFYQCYALKEITLPPSITEIKDEAFYECRSLSSIKIHEGTTMIGDYAFSGCTSIESIRIPRSVNKIGNGAFQKCTSLRSVTILNPDVQIGENAFYGCNSLEIVKGLLSSDDAIKGYMKRKVFKGCRSLETALGNDIHLVAEGKCWPDNNFPEGTDEWLERRLKKENISKRDDDATFIKDYNGDTAFQCAVRGGAPEEFLEILTKGFDKSGKTHLDHFADEYAKKNREEEFADGELTSRREENSKLIAVTPIGEGDHYLDSFEELLSSPFFDPRTVPEFIEKLNEKFQKRRYVFILMLDIISPLLRAFAMSSISGVYFDEDNDKKERGHIAWFVVAYLSILYLTFREVLQAKNSFLRWVTDPWSWIDFIIIVLSSVSTIMMHCKFYPDNNDMMKDFILWLTFFTWIYIIMKLRVVTEKFAVFGKFELSVT